MMEAAPAASITAPAANKERLRLWIRLLRAQRTIEAELRDRLKRRFETTLPRFDVMSALYRRPEGMLMSDLSRYLLVSNGNVTGIVDRLVTDGFVIRAAREGDRRTSIVSLTPRGRELFGAMAAEHEEWVAELLGGVAETEARALSATLKSFRSNWEGEA